MINKKAILVCIIAIIVGVVIANMLLQMAYQNCERFVEEIKDRPNSPVAQECKNLGFKIEQTDYTLP